MYHKDFTLSIVHDLLTLQFTQLEFIGFIFAKQLMY